MKIWLWRFSYTALTTFCLLGLTGASGPADKTSDVELSVGIVQRFGEKPIPKLQLEPISGDRLKLTFKNGNREQTLVTAHPVQLGILMQALPKKAFVERVVLGTYRTFETAEDSAQKWRAQGIEVEIAQPERWQVWAKREVYNTPLLRRLLLDTVLAAGSKTAYVNTEIQEVKLQPNWVVDGTNYSRSNLEITSGKNLIRVKVGHKLENTRLYAGRMEVQPNAYGTYTLVNEVPLETYLRGVVPNEIGAEVSTAALEAQTIIARTYALRNVRRFAIDNYQLCADTHCQVYYGLEGVSAKADEAIATTKGMVLTYQNELVDALYSSTTGGVTATFSDVWNGEDRPYLQPLIDASSSNIWDLSKQSLADEKNFEQFISQQKGFNESGKEFFRWRKESSLKDIIKGLQKFLLVKNSPYAKFQDIEDIKVTQRSKSGRILKLEITTDIGKFSLHKDEVRSAFAAPLSTLFYLQALNKGTSNLWGYAFIGGGLGHGVGFSQTGAQNLALLGWSNPKILQFYYPDTQIKILNSSIKQTN